MNGSDGTSWWSMAIEGLLTFNGQQRNHSEWIQGYRIADSLKEQQLLL